MMRLFTAGRNLKKQSNINIVLPDDFLVREGAGFYKKLAAAPVCTNCRCDFIGDGKDPGTWGEPMTGKGIHDGKGGTGYSYQYVHDI